MEKAAERGHMDIVEKAGDVTMHVCTHYKSE